MLKIYQILHETSKEYTVELGYFTNNLFNYVIGPFTIKSSGLTRYATNKTAPMK
jgi:hypothetical protein